MVADDVVRVLQVADGVVRVLQMVWCGCYRLQVADGIGGCRWLQVLHVQVVQVANDAVQVTGVAGCVPWRCPQMQGSPRTCTPRSIANGV